MCFSFFGNVHYLWWGRGNGKILGGQKLPILSEGQQKFRGCENYLMKNIQGVKKFQKIIRGWSIFFQKNIVGPKI